MKNNKLALFFIGIGSICISISMLSLIGPIAAISLGVSINNSSHFFIYLNYYVVLPVFYFFSLLMIVGFILLIKNNIFTSKKPMR